MDEEATDGARTEAPSGRRRGDPRWQAVVAILGALIVVGALTATLTSMSDRAQTTTDHARSTLGIPIHHLDATIDATTAGGAQLQMAAVSSGAERDEMLAASIASAEAAAESWTRYQAVAVHSGNEQLLAARYERDHEEGKGIAAEAIVPILRSNEPATLPRAQLLAGQRDREDLLALRAHYRERTDATLETLAADAANAGRRVRVAALVAVALIFVLGAVLVRAGTRTVRFRRRRAAAADLAAFEAQLSSGLELLDDDDQAFETAARAMAAAAPGVEVAIASSEGGGVALRHVVGGLVCGVSEPGGCPAVRAGTALRFSDSSALDSCPHLVGAPSCSATCLPISISGRASGIAQLTGSAGEAPAIDGAVRAVVRRVGERVTMLRAIAQFELEASLDPLTGLGNRRSLEAAVAQLHRSETSYAVAFADLDHFKRLNDVHGHHAGDQALRAFAATLTNSIRAVDLAGRWGGEEFVVVLPGCDQARAVEAMERVRGQLLMDGLRSATPSVTMSVGISVCEPGATFGETVARADEALLTAKAAGRDRIECWEPSTGELVGPRARSGPLVTDPARTGPAAATRPR